MSDLVPIRWGNMTVPYTAIWSAEIERRQPRVVMETWEGRRLAMLTEGVSAPGAGKPAFKVLHADRCREVVRKRLCQMCVKPLPETVVAVNQGQQDQYRPLLSDGLPMCPGCALEAFDACPGMQRQSERGELRLWQTQRGAWLVAPVLLGTIPESQGGDERINRLIVSARTPIFTGPKLVLTHWQLISRRDLETLARRTTEEMADV